MCCETSQVRPQGRARVVIPTFKSTRTIRQVVDAVLQSEDCPGIEIVVVDDGRNGDLRQLLSETPVTIVGTGGSGSAAMARNRGALGWGGRFLCFVDADVVVDTQCLKKLLTPIEEGRADATVGNYSKDVAGLTFSSRYKQLYISAVYERRSGYLRNEFWTAVSAIDTAVFSDLNGFDVSFRGACGEDVELGKRLTKNGYRIQAVPDALGHHRNSLSIPGLLRNDWRKGLMAMRGNARFDRSISDNRHATRRDMVAVALAAAVGIAIVAALGYSTSPTILMACALAIGYFLTRIDILRAVSSQGALFVVRAAGLMYLLDLVRVACVAAGLGLPLFAHGAAEAHVRRRPAETVTGVKESQQDGAG
jgi:GT2 family glycosyltransferase